MLVTYTTGNGLDSQFDLPEADVLDLVHNALSAGSAEAHGELDSAAAFFSAIVDVAKQLKLE